MTAPFVLFRVAAGARLGHGHLRRAEVLARALGRSAAVSIRGAGAPTSLPVAGCAAAAPTLAALAPAVLVLDDPHVAHASTWCRAAHRRGIPVVSLHDLGIARVPSTLAVDGSVAGPVAGWPAAGIRRGLPYAVIRPPVRVRRRVREALRVLVSLGGGPRLTLMTAIARELLRRHPGIEVLIASATAPATGLPAGAHLVSPAAGLAEVFARVDLAVLGGGVALYEAAAAGVPAVAVAVSDAQRPTIRGFVRRGTVRDAGRASGPVRAVAGRIVDRAVRAIRDEAWQRRARLHGPRLVDGRGARRVAREVLRLARGGGRG